MRYIGTPLKYILNLRERSLYISASSRGYSKWKYFLMGKYIVPILVQNFSSNGKNIRGAVSSASYPARGRAVRSVIPRARTPKTPGDYNVRGNFFLARNSTPGMFGDIKHYFWTPNIYPEPFGESAGSYLNVRLWRGEGEKVTFKTLFYLRKFSFLIWKVFPN